MLVGLQVCIDRCLLPCVFHGIINAMTKIFPDVPRLSNKGTIQFQNPILMSHV